MRLIEQSFEIIDQGYTKEDILKHIEKCGRVCYKSEDKITNDSYIRFCEMLKSNNHLSCYEHGTVYLIMNGYSVYYNFEVYKYTLNPYSKVNYDEDEDKSYITSNLRVLIENGWEDDLKYLCEPTEYHEKRITAKVVCPIGISREFNRHRKFSISEQSTRYCNYSRDKFDNELTFVIPYWVTTKCVENNYPSMNWSKAMEYSEKMYIELIQQGCKPQEAREVLPLSTATEVVYTGFVSDWKHFFKLRTSQAAHPQARELTISIYKEFVNRDLISNYLTL